MTTKPSDKMKEIEKDAVNWDKDSHGKWLIARVKQLEKVLQKHDCFNGMLIERGSLGFPCHFCKALEACDD